jgi:hypothetical protein
MKRIPIRTTTQEDFIALASARAIFTQRFRIAWVTYPT